VPLVRATVVPVVHLVPPIWPEAGVVFIGALTVAVEVLVGERTGAEEGIVGALMVVGSLTEAVVLVEGALTTITGAVVELVEEPKGIGTGAVVFAVGTLAAVVVVVVVVGFEVVVL
jgi:hypothetical protein